MGHVRFRSWHRPRSLTATLVAALCPLAVLVPVTIGSSSIAAAAPAVGYTASLIPTTQESYWAAVDSVTDRAYFASNDTDVVTVVDGATNEVTTTIDVPGDARGVAVDQTTDTVYVPVNPPAGSTSPPAVAVIDGATSTVSGTITLPTGSGPAGVTVDSSTGTVYVAEQTAEAVAVIDESTAAVTATISTAPERPYELAVDETTDVVWVGANSSDGSVLAISGTSNKVTDTIGLSAPFAEGVAVNPATDTVYAATATGDDLVVVNGATGAVSTTIELPDPVYTVAVDAGSGTVFASTISNASGTTWVIDATSNAITDTIERGGQQIAVDTSTGSAYVAPEFVQPDAVWVLTPSATNAMSPIITSTSAILAEGKPGSFTIQGSALPAATYTETGPLPAGVTLSSSGTLSGTPPVSAVGSYPITITASNGVAPDYSQAFTLTIGTIPSITPPSVTIFTVGTAVSAPFQVTGDPEPSVSVTGLPAGLALTATGPSQWELAGTPAAGSAGRYDPVFTAVNQLAATSVTIPLTVQQTPSITSAPTATFPLDFGEQYSMSATGYPVPTFTVTGSLPDGVSLVGSALVEDGPAVTPIGTYHFTVNATNGAGTASQAFTLIVESPVAVAAEGVGGVPYAQAPQLGPGWHSLGGAVVAPPAVAAAPNPNGTSPASPLFIATGTNKHLYIRSLTTGWQEISPVASCLGGPAAMITTDSGVSTLTVACEGTNQALYYDTGTVTASGLPTFTSGWKYLGGVLTAGPAVAQVGGVTTFFARGTTGHIYTRTVTAGYAEQSWACIGAPAAALQASTGVAVFACQGTNQLLYEATSAGTGWSTAAALNGPIIAGPGIAATSAGIVLLAELGQGLGAGTVGAIMPIREPFTSLGGTVTGGVQAAALG
jgi:YVTN family beta-propeller protein